MAIDTDSIQNANISIEDKKVLLAIAEVMNSGLTPIEDRVAALEATVDTADTGLADVVAALDATINTTTTGLVDVVADHESRIVALEGA